MNDSRPWLGLATHLGMPRTATALGIALGAVLGLVNGVRFPLSVPYLQQLTGQSYLDMCAFWSASAVEQRVVALGDGGRLLQATLLGTVDVLIPVLSCVFAVSALGALTRAWGDTRLRRWLLALPLVPLALDFAENASIALLLVRHPTPSPWLAGTEGLLSGLKFTAYGAVLLAVVVLGVARLFRPRAAEAS